MVHSSQPSVAKRATLIPSLSRISLSQVKCEKIINEGRRKHNPSSMEEDELVPDLRNQFKLSAISLAEAEAKRNDMEMSEPVSECIADLTLRYAEQLAKDLKLFAQHARRKSVKPEDVIISAHRNRGLTASLTACLDELRAEEPERAHRDQRKGKKFHREDEAGDPDYMPESDYTP